MVDGCGCIVVQSHIENDVTRVMFWWSHKGLTGLGLQLKRPNASDARSALEMEIYVII